MSRYLLQSRKDDTPNRATIGLHDSTNRFKIRLTDTTTRVKIRLGDTANRVKIALDDSTNRAIIAVHAKEGGKSEMEMGKIRVGWVTLPYGVRSGIDC